jgi:hypothetical protein
VATNTNVVFLEIPQIGKQARIEIDGQPAVTSIVRSIQMSGTVTDWYTVITASGTEYSGCLYSSRMQSTGFQKTQCINAHANTDPRMLTGHRSYSDSNTSTRIIYAIETILANKKKPLLVMLIIICIVATTGFAIAKYRKATTQSLRSIVENTLGPYRRCGFYTDNMLQTRLLDIELTSAANNTTEVGIVFAANENKEGEFDIDQNCSDIKRLTATIFSEIREVSSIKFYVTYPVSENSGEVIVARAFYSRAGYNNNDMSRASGVDILRCADIYSLNSSVISKNDAHPSDGTPIPSGGIRKL